MRLETRVIAAGRDCFVRLEHVKDRQIYSETNLIDPEFTHTCLDIFPLSVCRLVRHKKPVVTPSSKRPYTI